ncbi:hypothetical protein [Rhodococcus sp. NPDC049939]|uniref:AMIN-like domain-containing (lipo)protein n=1 Tax=Rhodococcus sp. NPDC049939 TaxID=3155511 RepID=UPI003409BD90
MTTSAAATTTVTDEGTASPLATELTEPTEPTPEEVGRQGSGPNVMLPINSGPQSSQGSDPNVTLPADSGPQSSAASASADLTLTDIRVGRHAGFDRVVYEFAGTGTPGWHARYVDSAAQDNSNRPISVAGDGILQIYIDRITFPYDNSGVRSFPPVPGTGAVVTEVREGVSWSEGRMQSFIGTTGSERPFTVFTLSGPTRVVVDIVN